VSSFVAGIDGGQSSTTALVGDERGRILASGTGGPADEIGAGPDSTRLRDALRTALDDARARAGLPEKTTFAAIVAGVSGYGGRVYGRAPELPSQRLILMHDAPIAHAGALGGEPGVVVIAGTGSVIYARDAHGAERTRGGWGFLFGDEGSAFWIAREALATMMRAQDEDDRAYEGEARAACEFFGARTLRELGRAFYYGDLTRARLASFAPAAVRFESLWQVVNRGADRLAAIACEAIRAGAPPKVALVGGTFTDARFRERVCAAIRAAVDDVQIVEPRYDPARGALLLAYRELGIAVAAVDR
jgi:N-acetylglucosamine kinase-like BadF-type ATPase